MRRAWARYRALDASERRELREAWRVLAGSRLRLALLSYRTCIAWSEGAGRAPSASPPSEAEVEEAVERVARAVRRAAFAVPGAKCLAQALAARVLLLRRGIVTELCLGAGREETDPGAGLQGRFVAHAWLERGGTPVFGGPRPEAFRRLAGGGPRNGFRFP